MENKKHKKGPPNSKTVLCDQKARGKSGPLFSFDVKDDVRLINDATVEKEESHAGKVTLPPPSENDDPNTSTFPIKILWSFTHSSFIVNSKVTVRVFLGGAEELVRAQ